MAKSNGEGGELEAASNMVAVEAAGDLVAQPLTVTEMMHQLLGVGADSVGVWMRTVCARGDLDEKSSCQQTYLARGYEFTLVLNKDRQGLIRLEVSIERLGDFFRELQFELGPQDQVGASIDQLMKGTLEPVFDSEAPDDFDDGEGSVEDDREKPEAQAALAAIAAYEGFDLSHWMCRGEDTLESPGYKPHMAPERELTIEGVAFGLKLNKTPDGLNYLHITVEHPFDENKDAAQFQFNLGPGPHIMAAFKALPGMEAKESPDDDGDIKDDRENPEAIAALRELMLLESGDFNFLNWLKAQQAKGGPFGAPGQEETWFHYNDGNGIGYLGDLKHEGARLFLEITKTYSGTPTSVRGRFYLGTGSAVAEPVMALMREAEKSSVESTPEDDRNEPGAAAVLAALDDAEYGIKHAITLLAFNPDVFDRQFSNSAQISGGVDDYIVHIQNTDARTVWIRTESVKEGHEFWFCLGTGPDLAKAYGALMSLVRESDSGLAPGLATPQEIVTGLGASDENVQRWVHYRLAENMRNQSWRGGPLYVDLEGVEWKVLLLRADGGPCRLIVEMEAQGDLKARALYYELPSGVGIEEVARRFMAGEIEPQNDTGAKADQGNGAGAEDGVGQEKVPAGQVLAGLETNQALSKWLRGDDGRGFTGGWAADTEEETTIVVEGAKHIVTYTENTNGDRVLKIMVVPVAGATEQREIVYSLLNKLRHDLPEALDRLFSQGDRPASDGMVPVTKSDGGDSKGADKSNSRRRSGLEVVTIGEVTSPGALGNLLNAALVNQLVDEGKVYLVPDYPSGATSFYRVQRGEKPGSYVVHTAKVGSGRNGWGRAKVAYRSLENVAVNAGLKRMTSEDASRLLQSKSRGKVNLVAPEKTNTQTNKETEDVDLLSGREMAELLDSETAGRRWHDVLHAVTDKVALYSLTNQGVKVDIEPMPGGKYSVLLGGEPDSEVYAAIRSDFQRAMKEEITKAKLSKFVLHHGVTRFGFPGKKRRVSETVAAPGLFSMANMLNDGDRQKLWQAVLASVLTGNPDPRLEEAGLRTVFGKTSQGSLHIAGDLHSEAMQGLMADRDAAKADPKVAAEFSAFLQGNMVSRFGFMAARKAKDTSDDDGPEGDVEDVDASPVTKALVERLNTAVLRTPRNNILAKSRKKNTPELNALSFNYQLEESDLKVCVEGKHVRFDLSPAGTKKMREQWLAPNYSDFREGFAQAWRDNIGQLEDLKAEWAEQGVELDFAALTETVDAALPKA